MNSLPVEGTAILTKSVVVKIQIDLDDNKKKGNVILTFYFLVLLCVFCKGNDPKFVLHRFSRAVDYLILGRKKKKGNKLIICPLAFNLLSKTLNELNCPRRESAEANGGDNEAALFLTSPRYCYDGCTVSYLVYPPENNPVCVTLIVLAPCKIFTVVHWKLLERLTKDGSS